MASCSSLLYLLLFSTSFLFVTSLPNHTLTVGGKNGWVLHPSESYDHWARRLRFQINDTLVFKYKKGGDSVLHVTQEDYFTCRTGNPVKAMASGDSKFTFNHSGLFFFISGNEEKCKDGQKLIVLVMASNHRLHNVSSIPQSPKQSPSSGYGLNPPSRSHTFPTPAPAPSKNGSWTLIPSSLMVILGLVSVVMGIQFF